MAECKVRLQLGKVWLEVDASNVKEAISALSEYGEVFSEKACGRCGSEDIAYDHRQHDGHDYYSLKCLACGSQLDFGQHRTGNTLFAKRKVQGSDEWDNEHRGWYKWQRGQERGGGEAF